MMGAPCGCALPCAVPCLGLADSIAIYSSICMPASERSHFYRMFVFPRVDDLPHDHAYQRWEWASQTGRPVEHSNQASELNTCATAWRSLKDILYRKRMERQLLQARGLAAGPEQPPDEDDVRSSPRVGLR